MVSLININNKTLQEHNRHRWEDNACFANSAIWLKGHMAQTNNRALIEA